MNAPHAGTPRFMFHMHRPLVPVGILDYRLWCLLSLRLAGWLIVTGLATLGCFVLLFMMIGDFSAEGFFSHLANLANRFGAADAVRRATFLSLVQTAACVLLAIVTACRWRSLRQSFTVGTRSHD